MLIYFVIGVVILFTCQIIERKYKVKKTYFEFKNYVSINAESFSPIREEIAIEKKIESLEDIIGKGKLIYLIEKKDVGIKVYPMNNNKEKIMSELQYTGILNKLEKQNPFFTFNIDTGSIYYQISDPYNNYVLWIYVR